MIREFNNLEEIKKYYDEKSNTYIFAENKKYIEKIIFNFDLDVEANIQACCIKAKEIRAYDVYAYRIDAKCVNSSDIKACYIYVNNINADDISALYIIADYISYRVVCYAYNSIKCKQIKGRIKGAQHFVLEGKLEVENEYINKKR